MKDKDIFNLGKKLMELEEESNLLGMFTGNRELLQCSNCGLMEDVDVNGG